jgi:hypothetical protein
VSHFDQGLAKPGPPALPRAVTDPERSPSLPRAVPAAWIWLLLALAGVFYLWTATSAANPLTFQLQKDDLYNRLVDGFLAGEAGLRERPNPAIARLADPWDPAQNGPLRQFHDVSYYKGRYYLYFGVTPAVTLLVPWRLLTGTHLGENMAAAVHALAAAAAMMLILRRLHRRHFPEVPRWIAGLCLLAPAWGNMVPVLLRRPVHYELAIVGASAWAMVALLTLFCGLDATGRRRGMCFALAGLAYGLALGCRPNYLFGAAALLVPFLPVWRAWRVQAPWDRAAARREGLALLLPLGTVGLALLAYNAVRFGDWAEFGINYLFSGLHPQRDALSSFSFAPVNAWFYFLAPAQFVEFFPFVEVVPMPWFAYPQGYTGIENPYGILPNLPFLAAGVLVWLAARRRGSLRPALSDLALGWAALAGLNLLVLLRIGGAANRYMVDFVPPLVGLAVLGVFWFENSFQGHWRLAGRAAWIAALVWTCGFNLLASLQHHDLLRIHNPTTYARLAHAFNRVPATLGEPGPEETGPLRVRLRLPTGQTGKAEPLVVTGLSYKADFLYVVYLNERQIMIGFEHTSHGGPKSAPIAVDPATDHVIEVDLGSLYPPREHPYFDGLAAVEVERRKRTLRVQWDGREVLAGTVDFYEASPGDVSVGSNPVQDAFGRRFTGRILGVERLPPRPPAGDGIPP